MIKISDREKLKPWMGIVLFILVVVFSLTAGNYVQTRFGLMGLVITEASFVVFTLLFCRLRGVKISEVLPVKKISIAEIFGIVLMTAGGYSLATALSGISILLMPKQAALSDELNSFLTGNGSSPVILILVIALLPAVCEEILMRGGFLSCFRSLKKDWLIVLIVAVAFGLFHIYPFRYLGTGCLGAILAYIMVKKNNILLPMLLHFINNSIGVIQGMGAQDSGSVTALLAFNDKATLFASYLMFAIPAPILLMSGAALLNSDARKAKNYVIASTAALVLLFSGVGLSMHASRSAMAEGTLLNWNYAYKVTDDFYNYTNLAECNITLEKDQPYNFDINAAAADTEISFNIYNENDELVFTKKAAGLLSVSEDLKLQPGIYKMEFNAGDEIVGKNFRYKAVVSET